MINGLINPQRIEESYLPDLNILARRKTEKKQIVVSYKLGEVIANGIRYFGQEKVVKRHRTAICICHCGESWRVLITLSSRRVL